MSGAMVEAVTRDGETNAKPLLDECSDAAFDAMDVTDGLDLSSATRYAEAVINVLRSRGLLNDAGVALCRAELGPLSVAVIKENSK